jgi:hypothetical protein
MPNFKQAPIKKVKTNRRASSTLDSKHREFVNEFHKDSVDKIPKLKQEQQMLKEVLKEKGTSMQVEEILDIKDAIHEISQKIKEIKQKKKDYFLDNSKYIFEYFENKKDISNSAPSTSAPPIMNTKTKMVNNFFKIKQPEQEEMNNLSKNIVLKYLCNVDETFLDVNHYMSSSDLCKYCNIGELIPIEDDGALICNNCYKNSPYLIENEKPSYKEPPKEVCYYAYKKINHFKEILSQFQGKETTQIPQEVIDSIKQQIKKERVQSSELTYNKSKEMLKKLGYNKYYEHIQFIKNKLGIPPPIFTPELEDTLCNLFNELLAPYSKFCPNDRVNFLNYYYVLYKLCELLSETEFQKDIPMLKDREKIIEQDAIWKLMCLELDWEFIPTI